MRTEIICGNLHKVVESPDGIDLVGVSVRRGNMNFSTICIDDCTDCGIIRTDEIFVVDNHTTVILHNYRIPEFVHVIAALSAFSGMKYAEIEHEDINIVQTI